jgi:hypothetical protein
MNHKRLYHLLILIGLMSLFSAACDLNEENDVKTIRGSGTVISETREVSDFDGVNLVGSGTVTISITGEESLTIDAEDNIMEVLTSDVEDGVLVLSTKENTSINPTREITYTVTVKDLYSVKLVGSGAINVAGVDSKTFTIELAGSGDIIVAGQADEVSVSLSGSGSVNTLDMQGNHVSVDLTGNGNADVYATERLDVNLTGNGNVRYTGNAEVFSNVTGNGTVSPR